MTKKDTYLKHYGVIGMKWGQRRYQNEDGSLTPEGVEHYRSMSTKHYERKAEKYEKKTRRASEAGKSDKSMRYAIKAEKAGRRLRASQFADKAYSEYAHRTSLGKAVAQNLIFGPWGSRQYQQSRALGVGRIGSAMNAAFTGSALRNFVARGTTAAAVSEPLHGKPEVKKRPNY